MANENSLFSFQTKTTEGQLTDLAVLHLNVLLKHRPTGFILPKSSRRDAGDPLKMKTKVALIRETGAERDLGQAESTTCTQEMLCSFYPAGNYKLVWRRPSGCFKLASEVVGTQVNHFRHFLERRTAFEIFHNVLDDSVELVAWKYAIRRRLGPASTRNMTDQVNGQNVGQ